MVNFTGRCLVHRAEILQLRGAWPAALDEARRAGERFARAMHESAAGEAAYRQGEIHRLRGEPAAAGQAYREASRYGWEPQPGLALLRLAEGDPDAAAIAIRRVMAETSRPLGRAGMVPAYVEILLAAGDADGARAACRELEEIAEGHRSGMLGAMAAQATGTVALADGDAWAALVSLRRAGELWRELEVPYEAARARVLVGLACRALGDEEDGQDGPGGCPSVFEQLGARPDVARVDSLLRGQPASLHGLSGRELEVAPPGGRRRDEPDDRRSAGAQRADGRPPRQQHPGQASRAVTGGGNRLRLPAPAALTPTGWNYPGHLLPQVGSSCRCASLPPPVASFASCSAVTIERNDTMSTQELERTRAAWTVSRRDTTSSSRRRR
jgi:tetratricopeptide (TPR) repeat protein